MSTEPQQSQPDPQGPEKSEPEQRGVVFPAAADGRRSTSALGRAVVADALRPVDVAGALDAEQETSWRSGYLVHFRRLLEAGLSSRDAALAVANGGLGSLHQRMRAVDAEGREQPLETWARSAADRTLDTVEVGGSGEAETELSLPFHGRRLRGDELRRPAGHLGRRGRDGADRRGRRTHGRWRTPTGCGSTGTPSRCSAPAPRWARSRRCCAGAPGSPRSTCPGRRSGSGCSTPPTAGRAGRCSRCRTSERPRRPTGCRTTPAPTWCAEVPVVADWLAGLPGTAGARQLRLRRRRERNVRVSLAVDALTTRLLRATATTWRWRSWPPRPTCSRSPGTRSRSRPAPTRAARPPRS